MESERTIVEAIRQAMPENADVHVVNALGGFSVGICWPLEDDPKRPNKMSTTIAIVVTDEAARDFERAADKDREEAFARVRDVISRKRLGFNPHHNVPAYDPPPVEQWSVCSEILPID